MSRKCNRNSFFIRLFFLVYYQLLCVFFFLVYCLLSGIFFSIIYCYVTSIYSVVVVVVVDVDLFNVGE